MLEAYAHISIAFEVTQVLIVTPDETSPGGFCLTEEPIAAPYLKDYDALEGEGPTQWAKHFDVSRWGFFSAWIDGQRVGGAAVAFNTPGIHMLEDRADLAVLWDIRVLPEARGQGVGAALFYAVECWARARGCTQLKVETQNINLPACRFYQRQGCVLGAVNRFAYPALPGEVQLLWYKALSQAQPG